MWALLQDGTFIKVHKNIDAFRRQGIPGTRMHVKFKIY